MEQKAVAPESAIFPPNALTARDAVLPRNTMRFDHDRRLLALESGFTHAVSSSKSSVKYDFWMVLAPLEPYPSERIYISAFSRAFRLVRKFIGRPLASTDFVADSQT